MVFCSCSLTCNIPGSRESLEAGNAHRIALLMGDLLWCGERSLNPVTAGSREVGWAGQPRPSQEPAGSLRQLVNVP